VIGNGDPVQTFGARTGDQIFRAGNTVSGKEGMRMQIDIERHCCEASLERAEWKALVLFVATALSAIEPATSPVVTGITN